MKLSALYYRLNLFGSSLLVSYGKLYETVINEHQTSVLFFGWGSCPINNLFLPCPHQSSHKTHFFTTDKCKKIISNLRFCFFFFLSLSYYLKLWILSKLPIDTSAPNFVRMKSRCRQIYFVIIGFDSNGLAVNCRFYVKRCVGGIFRTFKAKHWNRWLYILWTVVKIPSTNYLNIKLILMLNAKECRFLCCGAFNSIIDQHSQSIFYACYRVKSVPFVLFYG